ncbi:hypothetical protein D3C71_2109650 [compost metagenome]
MAALLHQRVCKAAVCRTTIAALATPVAESGILLPEFVSLVRPTSLPHHLRAPKGYPANCYCGQNQLETPSHPGALHPAI